MVDSHQMIDSVFTAVWQIFSQINGNPELHSSATRFCLALFFLYLLYSTIRMRAMAQYKPHQIVALCGCVLMMFRETSMLMFMSGWELGLYRDTIIHFLWPPIEHFFFILSMLCFCWYTVEASQYNKLRRCTRRIGWWVVGGAVSFCIYALVEWKIFFTKHFPDILYSYNECSVDWQSHLIVSGIAIVGLLGAMFRYRGSSYLMLYWVITLIEHSSRTVIFAFYHEEAWQATIFHAMHIWAIPLLLLHFINAYVLKMSNCVQCKREVVLQ